MAISLRQRYHVWSTSKPYILLTMTFALLVGKLFIQTTGFHQDGEALESTPSKSRTNTENQNRHVPRNLHRSHSPLHTRDSRWPSGHQHPVLNLHRSLNLRPRNDSPQSLHRHIHWQIRDSQMASGHWSGCTDHGDMADRRSDEQ